MAFPVPSHLPRKSSPQDVSSNILSRIAEASSKTLNAELALSWIHELDKTILETKVSLFVLFSEERAHMSFVYYRVKFTTGYKPTSLPSSDNLPPQDQYRSDYGLLSRM
jgi:hypothetical protein